MLDVGVNLRVWVNGFNFIILGFALISGEMCE